MSETGQPEADREGELPHPRAVYQLFGHDPAAAAVEQAFAGGRMHHAWMITGPKGVGKATLAWRIARRVLGAAPAGDGPLSADPEDPVCRRLEALSHPDFLLIRRPYDDKRGRIRAEITVEESRRAPDFFSRSAGGHDGWRVCLVDAADEMNANAANAILKTLEEPPKRGLLLLVVNAPGRLPATIRSRCRRLSLRAPDIEATADWLSAAHGLAPELAAKAAALAGGAPGRALALAATDAPALKDELDRVLDALPRLDRAAIARLAAKCGQKDGDAFRRTLLDFLGVYAQGRARTLALEQGGVEDAGRWVDAGDALARLARESETLYLDPKQTTHAAFAILQDAAAAD
ncbi:DNA polymerase III subunit delta' [Marinicauda salina]|uniref:DNA polymerase III subunit delta n=1 Tax=Marinicauda salina TaxID=2135793 RepID=A0A2U2BT58_9PROT|nr:DNA polymerase III subunit delta' [Marinicauda salina]PWE17187.1 DNA polymerase III subunit delta' [Marinicauda salina]